MNLHELVSDLIYDTQDSLVRFAPELILCATIIVMLFVKIFDFGKRLDAFILALAGVIVGFYFVAPWANLGAERFQRFLRVPRRDAEPQCERDEADIDQIEPDDEEVVDRIRERRVPVEAIH